MALRWRWLCSSLWPAPVAAVPVQSRVALKVLVLGTVPDTDPTLGGIFMALNSRGQPYDYIDVIASGYSQDKRLPLIDLEGDGKYYAIIKTSRDLAYEASPGYWPSALRCVSSGQ